MMRAENPPSLFDDGSGTTTGISVSPTSLVRGTQSSVEPVPAKSSNRQLLETLDTGIPEPQHPVVPGAFNDYNAVQWHDAVPIRDPANEDTPNACIKPQNESGYPFLPAALDLFQQGEEDPLEVETDALFDHPSANDSHLPLLSDSTLFEARAQSAMHPTFVASNRGGNNTLKTTTGYSFTHPTDHPSSQSSAQRTNAGQEVANSNVLNSSITPAPPWIMSHDSPGRFIQRSLENDNSPRYTMELILDRDFHRISQPTYKSVGLFMVETARKNRTLLPQVRWEKVRNSRTEPGQVMKNQAAIRERPISKKERGHKKRSVVAQRSVNNKVGK